jgi:hypothetical protein
MKSILPMHNGYHNGWGMLAISQVAYIKWMDVARFGMWIP